MGREVKRVAMDFDWPLREVWQGYLNPFYTAKDCEQCDGGGYSPEAVVMQDQWYGNVYFDPRSTGSTPFKPEHPAIVALATRNVTYDPRTNQCRAYQSSDQRAIDHDARRLANLFNSRWSHHLSQDDVDALIADNRLHDLTHTFVKGEGWKPKDPPYHPTAREVNEWSLHGFGHDSINSWICIKARCKREGVSENCSVCQGHGNIWPCNTAKWLYETFENIEPPTGDGWQMWETTTNGSPISPVFATPEELARWLANNGTSAMGSQTADYDTWLRMIQREWAPSMVTVNGQLLSGVEAVSQPDDD